jgi:hypothetical protein
MQSNTKPDFVGLVRLKQQHAAQLAEFEQWAASGQWEQFHSHHYDWWMFPINQPSSYGFAYTVYQQEIEELKTDPEFMRNLLRGAELLAASWGWNLNKADFLPDPASAQKWHSWPIRLHKAAQSLKLFGLEKEFQSFRKYALHLIQAGEEFTFRGKDLARLFQNKQ